MQTRLFEDEELVDLGCEKKKNKNKEKAKSKAYELDPNEG